MSQGVQYLLNRKMCVRSLVSRWRIVSIARHRFRPPERGNKYYSPFDASLPSHFCSYYDCSNICLSEQFDITERLRLFIFFFRGTEYDVKWLLVIKKLGRNPFRVRRAKTVAVCSLKPAFPNPFRVRQS